MNSEAKKFIIHSLLFLFLLSLFISGIALIYNNKVFIEKAIYRSDLQFKEDDQGAINTIFFGDSHPASDVNPAYIKDSFNYSISDETYEQTYYKIKSLLDIKKDLCLIVLPLDVHSFSNYRENPYSDIRYWINFMSFDEIKRESGKSSIVIASKIFLPFIGNGLDFKRVWFNNKKMEINKGWQRATNDFSFEQDKEKIASKRVSSQVGSPLILVDQYLLGHFADILKLAETKEKNVVLIKYPLSPAYLEALNSQSINIDGYYADLDNFLIDYKNVYLLDYQQLIKDNSLFSDVDHLNDRGSEVLSKKINEDLIKNKLVNCDK